MIQFLLKFLGVKIDAAQEVTSVSLQLRHGDWLGSTVFIALLVAAFAWAVYRYVGGHKELAPARRRWLTGLRLALFSLLLFILLRPVFPLRSRTGCGGRSSRCWTRARAWRSRICETTTPT